MLDRMLFFFFSSRRRHTRLQGDWSSDVCSSDLPASRVVSVWVDQDVDVFRKTVEAMRSDGIAADERVLNAGFVEQTSQLFDVLPCGRTRVFRHVWNAGPPQLRWSSARGRGSFRRGSCKRRCPWVLG